MTVAALATNFGTEVKGITDIEQWAETADLNWQVEERDLIYDAGNGPAYVPERIEGKKALINSNTGTVLGVVSDKYKVVQPLTMLETFKSAVDNFGFEMDRLGTYGDGKVIWGRADIHEKFLLDGADELNYYMYFVTSTDGSAATHTFVSTLRAACMNALNMASKAADIYMNVRHSMEYKPSEMDSRLQFLGEAKNDFENDIQLLSDVSLGGYEGFHNVYGELFGTPPQEEGRAKSLWVNKKKNIHQLMHTSAGAELGKLADSYWNFLNAITYDIDHNNNARSLESSHRHSIMRAGAKKKVETFEKLVELAQEA